MSDPTEGHTSCAKSPSSRCGELEAEVERLREALRLANADAERLDAVLTRCTELPDVERVLRAWCNGGRWQERQEALAAHAALVKEVKG